MSFAAWTRATLTGDSTVSGLVGTRVTPYVRNREDDFPCVVYSIPREELDTPASGTITNRSAELSVACMSRSYLEADAIAEAVIDALQPGTQGSTCVDSVRVTALEREYQDSYDGKPDLIYLTTLTAILHRT